MVHFQWNSKVQRSNAIRFTAKQTIDDTSRSGPGRTIIGDFGIHFEVNKMRNYSGAAMAPLKVSLVSGVRSMRLHLSLLFFGADTASDSRGETPSQNFSVSTHGRFAPLLLLK